MTANCASTDNLMDNNSLVMESLETEPSSPKSPDANHSLVTFFIEGDASKQHYFEDEQEREKCESKCNKKKARHSAARLVSVLYAMVLIMIGIVCPVSQALVDTWRTSGVVVAFMMYMSTMSIVFLIYLLIENEKIKRQPKNTTLTNLGTIRKPTNEHVATEASNTDIVRAQNGDIQLEKSSEIQLRERTVSTTSSTLSTFSDVATDNQNQQPRFRGLDVKSLHSSAGDEEIANYIILKTQMASQAHEGTSFYVRFGVLLFAVAYILFLSLEIEYFYSDEMCETKNQKYAWVLFFHLSFVIVQTFFLFKHQMLHTRRKKSLLSFGLMHVISTNFVVWVTALVSEIRSGVLEAGHDSGHYMLNNETENSTDCPEDIIERASHYLFPFILEYSLIATGTFLAMFNSLDIKLSGDVFRCIRRYLRKAKREQQLGIQPEHEPISNKMLDKSHTGLFLGMLCLTGTIISFILVEYRLSNATDGNDFSNRAETLYHSTDLILHSLAAISVIIGVVKMLNLEHSFLRNAWIDYILLNLSLSGLILYELFKAICIFSEITEGRDVDTELVLHGVSSIVILIEALLQAIFIISGMQKFSESKEHRIEKPGRGVITFLLIINLSIWFLKSFAETDISIDLMESFYGVTPWQMIMHTTLPLMLFFRFHSSVCLADMWLSAYENEENPIHYISL